MYCQVSMASFRRCPSACCRSFATYGLLGRGLSPLYLYLREKDNIGEKSEIVTSKWYISCLEYKPKKKYQVQCTAYFKQKYGDSSSGWTNTSSMGREKVLFICLLFLFLSCVGAIWIYRWCIYKTIYARLPVLVEVYSDMPIYGCFWTLLLFDYDFPKERIRMIRDR